MDAPRATTTAVDDAMLHHEAGAPDEGVLPTFAQHAKLVVNPVPVSVIVLLVYAVGGLTPLALGAALMVNDWALFGPSIATPDEFLVVTAAFDTVADVPYVTDGMVQEKLDAGLAAVVMVTARLPPEMPAVPPPRPLQLTAELAATEKTARFVTRIDLMGVLVVATTKFRTRADTWALCAGATSCKVVWMEPAWDTGTCCSNTRSMIRRGALKCLRDAKAI